ncbi:MAG: hypoxanthine phosphoribosyltransferase [Oscillospiraceae bacterium]|jgi:hypoxanthine phosphoribosyltransferase
MKSDIKEILFSAERIAQRVEELGVMLMRDYKGKNPVFLGVLKGSFIFMADLIRHVDLECEVDFMSVSSYGSGTSTTGAVKILQDLRKDVEGRHVVIVEDILDSGVTLNYLIHYLKGRNPASVSICALLDKPSRRKAEIAADYVGFVCPDAFVVGYGLDYAEKYRNLPYIGVLRPEVYGEE